MKIMRKIVEIDEELCDGCGQCIPDCAEGALAIVDGKARIVKDMYCDGLGACLGACPQGALAIVEREAEDFDEEAAMAHVARQRGGASPHAHGPAQGGGCPGSAMASFSQPGKPGKPAMPAPSGPAENLLGHWPVQVRLIPPDAPFLRGADLVIAADCAAVAYADFHRQFVGDKAIMMGCPKFDGDAGYVERFTALFRLSGVKSVTVVRMEVPCCMGLPAMVREGLAASGMDIPLKEVIVGRQGALLEPGLPGM